MEKTLVPISFKINATLQGNFFCKLSILESNFPAGKGYLRWDLIKQSMVCQSNYKKTPIAYWDIDNLSRSVGHVLMVFLETLRFRIHKHCLNSNAALD